MNASMRARRPASGRSGYSEGVAALIALLLAGGASPVAEIPCRIVQNLVLLDVRLNARSAVAMLDSGADATYADDTAALAAGASKGAAIVASGAGAQSQNGWNANGLGLTFPGVSLKRTVARAFPLRFPIPGGPKIEAVVGHDLFADYIVEIDYAGHKVRLYDPKGYRPPANAQSLAMTLDRNVPFASVKLRLPGASDSTIRVLVDTGVNVGLYLTAAYTRRERLVERFPDAVPSPGGTGIGGGTKTRLLSGIKLGFGGQSIDGQAWFDLSAGGVTGPDATFDGLLGGDILRHFVVAFDEPHGRLIVRPAPTASGSRGGE